MKGLDLGLGNILGGAASLVSGLFGGISRRRMLRKQENMINEQKRDNQDWYDRRYNEDATQRADAQRILALTEERIRNRNRAAEGTAAVMGGTEESVAAAKAAGNQTAADAASQIAAAGEARKDQIENQYLTRKDAYDEELRKIKAGTPGALDIASGAIGGAALGLGKGLGV